MKKTLVFAAIIAVLALTTAPVFAFNWTDDFESGNLNTWGLVKSTNSYACSALDISTAQHVSGTQSAHIDKISDKMYHDFGQSITGEFTASWYIMDDVSPRISTYVDVRSYALGGYDAANPNSFSTYAAGIYNTGMNSTYYQAKVGTSGGSWINLHTARATGWHKFTVTRDADNLVSIYVDNIFDTSVQSTAIGMNTLTMGAIVSSYDASNVWIDDVTVSTNSVPEPGSFLALGAGLAGMIGMLRRRMA